MRPASGADEARAEIKGDGRGVVGGHLQKGDGGAAGARRLLEGGDEGTAQALTPMRGIDGQRQDLRLVQGGAAQD